MRSTLMSIVGCNPFCTNYETVLYDPEIFSAQNTIPGEIYFRSIRFHYIIVFEMFKKKKHLLFSQFFVFVLADINNLGISSSPVNASFTRYQCLADSLSPVSFVWNVNGALLETRLSTIVLEDATTEITLVCTVHNQDGEKSSSMTIPTIRSNLLYHQFKKLVITTRNLNKKKKTTF